MALYDDFATIEPQPAVYEPKGISWEDLYSSALSSSGVRNTFTPTPFSGFAPVKQQYFGLDNQPQIFDISQQGLQQKQQKSSSVSDIMALLAIFGIGF